MKGFIQINITITGLCAVLLACKTTPGVKQEPDFDSIYDFKINKSTIADIRAANYQLNEETVAEYIEGLMSVGTPAEGLEWELLCPGIRKFRVKDFRKDDISFTDANLLFQNDSLIKFEAWVSFPLKDILKSKYPNYIQTSDGDGYYYVWYNKYMQASIIYTKKFGDCFDIADTSKIERLDSLKKIKMTDYLKGRNSKL